MSPDQQIRAVHIRRRLEKIDDYICNHEVRAAIPPASCSEPELFSRLELDEARRLRELKTVLLAELNQLEGQSLLAI